MLTDCLQKALDTDGITLDELRPALASTDMHVGWVERSETHHTTKMLNQPC